MCLSFGWDLVWRWTRAGSGREVAVEEEHMEWAIEVISANARDLKAA